MFSFQGVPNNSEPRIPPDVSISDELLMNIQHFRRSSSPELPDTVTKLETVDGCKVYLVGTAHFSKESQDDVEKVLVFPMYVTCINIIIVVIQQGFISQCIVPNQSLTKVFSQITGTLKMLSEIIILGNQIVFLY